MKADRYLFPHYKFYVREVKIKAYAQLLESYSSLTLGYMAQAVGVTGMRSSANSSPEEGSMPSSTRSANKTRNLKQFEFYMLFY